ncbi:6494_t:CDS:2 [Diversispora eburnea]|uniref:6494_t:CDS:1 n=1 Tax=Diversispora eburnea TaxID=1213867 RepID=A0A9N8YQ58_9GLOM|nr:6494_t:CDS:2 [Diversispora eburnea]
MSTKEKENFIEKFETWSSGDDCIDTIIQESQIYNYEFNLQWIPYENFYDTKQIADNEYYTLHLSKLRKHTVVKWDREDCGVVALKELKDYGYDIFKFIEAIRNIAIDGYYSSCITRFFGVSKNPSTQNYIIVMESQDYAIHSFLSDHFLKIWWGSKTVLLRQIIENLNTLHENNIVHCDLHSRNILMKNYADDNREIMSEQKLLRSLYNFHPQSCYISRHIYTLYGLQDSLEDIKSGKYPNLYTHDMDSKKSSKCIDLET